MKAKLILLSVFFIAAALTFTFTASAAIPHLMNYQGKATDQSGAPLNGTYNLTFRIYNSETGGTAKWTETQPNVIIANGVFQVQLGSITPLNLPFNEPYWVSAEINTDGEMTPRTRLVSVGYAFTAENSTSTTNGVPTGVIMAWATDTPPDGWLLCDGRAVSRATYAGLFGVIGSNYGAGDGSTTFNLPNMQGRLPVGKSTDAEFSALNQKGGEKTHTLSIAEMPSHAHKGMLYTTSGSRRMLLAYGYNWEINVDEFDTGSAGGGQPHNTLPPYITLNYIVKI